MNRRNIIVAAACFIACAWVLAQQAQVTPNNTDARTEAKVSESRKDGKYQSTTAVFRDNVLISKKQEVSAHDDGKIDVVFMKLFRDGEMTYASTFNKAAKNTIRSYYHDGKMAVSEGDEDGDGFFETMILFDAKEQPVEAFSKTKDGTVTQFTKEKLAELKKSFEKFQE